MLNSLQAQKKSGTSFQTTVSVEYFDEIILSERTEFTSQVIQ